MAKILKLQNSTCMKMSIYLKSTDYDVNVLDQVQGVLNLSKELHNHMNDGQGFENAYFNCRVKKTHFESGLKSLLKDYKDFIGL